MEPMFLPSTSTKQCINSLIDDVELISKQFLDMIAAPKTQKNDDLDTDDLLELLIQKDVELRDQLKLASEQAELQKKHDTLKAEVEKRDLDICILQKSLKEAESILGIAIYQSKQKLTSIERANKKKISSEELIKYAHKISASNAVAAPPSWSPGDPRRPYPTDIDMRCGILARLNDATINHQALSSANTLSEVLGHGRQPLHIGNVLNSVQQQQPPYQWQPSAEHAQPPPSHSPRSQQMTMEPPVSRVEDPGEMSSDSSSSSSSDE